VTDLILKISNKKFHISLSRGAELFHVDGRTGAFCNIAKAFK